MSHYADDFGLHIELREIDVFANGIFMGEIGAGKNVVDVDDHRSVLVVLRSDEAAALERGSHGLLETGLDQIKHRLGHFVVDCPASAGPRSRRATTSHGSSGVSRA